MPLMLVSVGEIVSIISAVIAAISVIVAMLVFNRNLRKDKNDANQKTERFRTETSYQFKTISNDVGEIKEQVNSISQRLEEQEKKIAIIETKIKSLEREINARNYNK